MFVFFCQDKKINFIPGRKKNNMILADLINRHHHPIFQACGNSMVWEKPAEDVTNLDLLMLYTRIKNESFNSNVSSSDIAQKGIDLVYSKIKEAFESYQIEAISCKQQTLSRQLITMPEIINFMEEMTIWQRRAFMFALHSGLTPTEVSRLHWKDALKLTLCDSAIEILDCQIRHIHIANVFYDGNTQEPLAGLEGEFYHITKMRWVELQERFDNVILVDHSEALGTLKVH